MLCVCIALPKHCYIYHGHVSILGRVGCGPINLDRTIPLTKAGPWAVGPRDYATTRLRPHGCSLSLDNFDGTVSPLRTIDKISIHLPTAGIRDMKRDHELPRPQSPTRVKLMVHGWMYGASGL